MIMKGKNFVFSMIFIVGCFLLSSCEIENLFYNKRNYPGRKPPVKENYDEWRNTEMNLKAMPDKQPFEAMPDNQR